ncbi:Hypothetical protein SMAX5B_011295 [Scophthalmus maximus]|uniref:Uncharacterized protein n=1 Tax=Scophthalmus maximus TaxID=52904 RepID=A0A2U9CMA4_SCOMX|nr:Hypothetical protein SMAX5B_011295 [Scophthalmus maximus]
MVSILDRASSNTVAESIVATVPEMEIPVSKQSVEQSFETGTLDSDEEGNTADRRAVERGEEGVAYEAHRAAAMGDGAEVGMLA